MSHRARERARHAAVLVTLTLAGACGGAEPPIDDADADGTAGSSSTEAGSSDVDATGVDATGVDSTGAESSTSEMDGTDSTGGDEPEPDLEIMPFEDQVWTWDQTSDACGYSNNGNPFWVWDVIGREPVEPGEYPVFIYLHGTGDVAETPVAVSMIESMARRGFVAASVAYDSLGGLGQTLEDPLAACPIAEKKGECLFGSGEGSAVTKLCARANADCDRGIVLAGHSQGAALAIAAADHDERVRGAYALAGGLHLELTVDLGGEPIVVAGDAEPCLHPDARALPVDRLRVVNGESEYAFGDHLQQDVRDITGMDCASGELECLREDGSGWSFFPDAANEDGRGLSQHCYMANMPAGDCTESTGLNSTWTDATASYSREPSLKWLRGLTDP